eukprot:SAG11_NODE_12709_length_689_cov_0.962712_2_plen_105_part_00
MPATTRRAAPEPAPAVEPEPAPEAGSEALLLRILGAVESQGSKIDGLAASQAALIARVDALEGRTASPNRGRLLIVITQLIWCTLKFTILYVSAYMFGSNIAAH